MKKSTRIHKLLSVALSAVLLLSALPFASFAAAATSTYNDFEYTTANGEVTIKRYAGTAESVIVPAEIDGKPVTVIGDGAFSNPTNTRPKSVTLPKSITKIGMMAFLASTDTEINLADLENLTYIGAYAFVDTGLSGDLIVPESVTEIGASAFTMTKITSLHLGKNVKPVSVQTGNGWKELVKTVMPAYASLVENLMKPYSSTESERNIAMNCMNLTKITVDSQNPYLRSYGGALFSKDMTEMYCYPSGKQMHTYIIPLTVRNFYNAFGGFHMPPASIKMLGNQIDLMDNEGNGIIKLGSDWTDFGSNNPLKSVVIPAGVTSICEAAFYNTGLTSVYIPKNVTIIGKKAFWHCRGLTTVGFDRNSSYTELPEQCFKDCEALKSVTFGKVDYLAALAFGNCSTIESIDLTNVLSLDSTAFDDCTNLSEVIYRDTEDTTVQAQSYAAKRFAASADAESTKATVSESAFSNTDSLKTVMLGNSVAKIDSYAFANCKNLTTAYISGDIAEENISDTAFDGCSALTIVVPTTNCGAYRYAVKHNIPVTTMVISAIANQTYTGEEIEPAFTVTASGKQLTKDVDYEVFYKDNVDAGTASITVVGKGNYSIFAALAKFAILRRDLSEDVLVSNILPQTADENGVEPELALSCGNYILQKDVDYTVVYENNTVPGTASVTITGIGNFKGSKTIGFTIAEAPDDAVIVTLPGDVDGDGQLALTDYAFIKSLAIGCYVTDDPYILAAADINGDGAVDMFDAAILNQKLNGYA